MGQHCYRDKKVVGVFVRFLRAPLQQPDTVAWLWATLADAPAPAVILPGGRLMVNCHASCAHRPYRVSNLRAALTTRGGACHTVRGAICVYSRVQQTIV
jgi:hypothetical protein